MIDELLDRIRGAGCCNKLFVVPIQPAAKDVIVKK
jgi:hypothetical protein